MKTLWRVSNGRFKTDYIRADSLEEAKSIFDKKHFSSASEIQPVADRIYAVYFSDNPCSPAFFKGTKKEAEKGARLYIRQWGLDAKIDRIELK